MRKRSVTLARVVGRLQSDDVEADEAERRAEAEAEAVRLEEERQERARQQRRVAEAAAVANAIEVRTEIQGIPATYADDDGPTLALIDKLLEPQTEALDIIDTEFRRRVADGFGRTTLDGVEPLLQTADAAEECLVATQAQRCVTTAARESLASGLALGRLRRRRARLQGVLQLASKIEHWHGKVDHIYRLVDNADFVSAIDALGLTSTKATGTTISPDDVAFFASRVHETATKGSDIKGSSLSREASLSNGCGDTNGHRGDSTTLLETPIGETTSTPDWLTGCEELFNTTIGAAALKHWMLITDRRNPYVIDHIRRAVCRAFATPRLLDAFSCFTRGAADAAAGAVALVPEDEDAVAVASISRDASLLADRSTTAAAASGGPLRRVGKRTKRVKKPTPVAKKPAAKKSDLDWSSDEDVPTEVIDDHSSYETITDSDTDVDDPADSQAASTVDGPGSASTFKLHLSPVLSPTAQLRIVPSMKSLAAQFEESLSEDEEAEVKQQVQGALFALQRLNLSPDAVARFFSDSFQLTLDFVLLQTLTDTLGEEQNTWEAIADTLVPSELQRTTEHVVSGMEALIRNAGRVQSVADELAPISPLCAPHDGLDPKKLPVAALLPALSRFRTVAVQKCLASLMAYASRVPLHRAELGESLQLFRQTIDFAARCRTLAEDSTPSSTGTALTQLVVERLDEYYRTNLLGSVLPLLNLEEYATFGGVSIDDFAVLDMWMPAETSDRRGGVCEAEPSGGSVGSVLESVSVFTFSSMKVCQRMLDVANVAGRCPPAASACLRLASRLAAFYAWFVCAGVAAAAPTIPLYEDTSVKEDVRQAARTICAASTELAEPEGYPLFPGAPCNSWKARMSDPGSLYAAKERSTALTSLDAVCHTFQLCIKSTTLLLDASALDEHTTFSQNLHALCTGGSRYGFRRLASSLLSQEVLVGTIEKAKWDDKNAVGGEGSALTKFTRDTFTALHDRLQASVAKEPSAAKPIQRLLQHVVFNVCAGFLEGIVKVRKWSEAGRAAIGADAQSITRQLRAMVPNTPVEMMQWVTRYATAVGAPVGSGVVEGIVSQHHAVYTERQLLALCRESESRRKELSALLSKLGHVDKLPIGLMDSRV